MKRPGRYPHGPDTHRGLGLVEIMVALAISAVLLTGVIQIFLGSKLSYRVSEANARVQEGGRFAIEFMNDDLRMAGYRGCFQGDPSTVDNILNNPDAFNWNISVPLEGHEWTGAGWSPPLPALLAGEVREGTDVIVTRGLARDGVNVNRDTPGANINVDPPGNVAIGDILMVTDCNRASVFQATNVNPTAGGSRILIVHSATGTPGNKAPPQLSGTYGPDAELARLQTSVYYVGTNTEGEPALFRRSLSNVGGAIQMPAQELVEGVEDLQILYGEDTNADGVANRYVRAHEATMTEVASVRISLLLRTEDNIASTPQTYVYDGEEVTADDLRVRRVFTSTVKLRNRGVL